MLSPLRNRFGIPGVISVIALVFAMLGGAYAASNDNGGGNATASAKAKKGPRGPKGPKGDPGPAGPQGPAGPAGAKGDTGAAGAKGDTGAKGATGSMGLTGSKGATGAAGATGATGFSGFTETLPSGKTETGSWGANLVKGTSAGYVPISFAIPLAAELGEAGVHVIPAGGEGEEGCTGGTASEPKADPGNLCVYVASSAGGGEIKGVAKAGGEVPEPGASVSGAYVFISAEENAAAVRGTFAVAAP